MCSYLRTIFPRIVARASISKSIFSDKAFIIIIMRPCRLLIEARLNLGTCIMNLAG